MPHIAPPSGPLTACYSSFADPPTFPSAHFFFLFFFCRYPGTTTTISSFSNFTFQLFRLLLLLLLLHLIISSISSCTSPSRPPSPFIPVLPFLASCLPLPSLNIMQTSTISTPAEPK
ncbi:hypothetical protein E2C01_039098 [Portunus trituberculatus]|uniref:Uncharacterized protein n=1 Tax=Portunus trituberculatus TaxID=210409 RepID=A0A5B7FCQ4_PORTR|nr:hypothetical protein [Portunus trituberculatus]